MSNTIVKAAGFDYTPTAIGYPGTPPAPARSWYSYEPHNGFFLQGPGVSYTWVQQQPALPGLPYPNAEWAPTVPPGTDTGGTGQVPQLIWLNQYLNRPVFTPAQPVVAPYGRPPAYASKSIFDFNLGWNAGARSLASMVGDGMFTFNFLPSTIGAVAGLNVTDSKGNYANITMAWAVINHHAKVFINGSFQYDSGPFLSTDTFKIRRVLGNIEFLKNGTKVLTYNPGQVTLIGTAFLDVSLYAAGDGVDNPTFVPVSTCGATMLPARAICGLTLSRVHFVNSSMLPATASCGVKNDCRAVSAPMDSYCGGNGTKVCSVSAVSAGLTVNCFTGVIGAFGGIGAPTYALTGVNAEQLSTYATCLTGQIAEVYSAMAPAMTRAGRLTNAQIHGVAAPATAYCSAYDGNLVGRLGSQFYGDDLLQPVSYLVVTMTSSGSFVSAMSWSAQLPASMISTLTTTSSALYQAILTAAMQSTMTGGFSTPLINDQYQVWVINTETMAASQYESFPFNGFCNIRGQYYGTRTDGVYLLEGDTDNGSPVRSSVNLGRWNLETLKMKQVPNLYIGVQSNDVMLLKVTTPAGSYIYSTKSFDPNEIVTQRIDVGKGLRATYFTLELYNQNGANFSIDDMEFRIVKSDSRRIY